MPEAIYGHGVREAVGYGERVLRWVVRQHFRIPPAAFWSALLLGTALAPFLPLVPGAVAAGVALIGLYGVMRWRIHRKRNGLLILPQPVTVDPSDPLAMRAQQLVLESLSGRLTPDELALVHPISARVGPTDTRLAEGIRRRLGAAMIVVARIDDRKDGGWSLFAGVLTPPERDLVHVDWHTRDWLPTRGRWDAVVGRLTPTRDVQDVQDPLLMSGELEAIVRSVVGRVAFLVGDLDRADKELAAAIEASGNSRSHVIDEIRCVRADSLMQAGRPEEARELLRERATRDDPSPELLRAFARVLGPQPGGPREAKHAPGVRERANEAIAALRRAADVRSDPKRAVSLYNLSALHAADPADEEAALAEAMRISRFYRHAWYARRSVGAFHWHRGLAAKEAGRREEATREFTEAASWYSAALRSRPRFRVLYRDGGTRSFVRWFPRSAKLQANAADAHAEAGHRLRARWHGWRTNRLRRRYRNRALRQFRRQDWLRAYANYDWATIGVGDFPDVFARVMRAVCQQQAGNLEDAARDYAETDELFPGLAPLLRLSAADIAALDLPNGLPGKGPESQEELHRELERRGFPPPSND